MDCFHSSAPSPGVTPRQASRSGILGAVALDADGGGVEADRHSSDDEMYDLLHAMRTRVVTRPACDGTGVIAAIPFEQTMTWTVDGPSTGR